MKIPEADADEKGLAGDRDAGHAQAEAVAGAETTSRDREDQVDGDDPEMGRASTCPRESRPGPG